jgi:hypothetical protein
MGWFFKSIEEKNEKRKSSAQERLKSMTSQQKKHFYRRHKSRTGRGAGSDFDFAETLFGIEDLIYYYLLVDAVFMEEIQRDDNPVMEIGDLENVTEGESLDSDATENIITSAESGDTDSREKAVRVREVGQTTSVLSEPEVKTPDVSSSVSSGPDDSGNSSSDDSSSSYE